MALFRLVLAAALLAGCGAAYCKELSPQLTQTTYLVHATLTTPKGQHYDPSGLPINPALIDRLTDEVFDCLRATYPKGDLLTADPLPGGPLNDGPACGQAKHFTLPTTRGCLTLKIASDWHLSQSVFAGSYQQLLHDQAPSAAQGCGKDENGPLPCYWRAGVQDKVTVVATPSLWVYKDPLVRLLTGCAFPWSSPRLTACMQPTTDPLSDGTGP